MKFSMIEATCLSWQPGMHVKVTSSSLPGHVCLIENCKTLRTALQTSIRLSQRCNTSGLQLYIHCTHAQQLSLLLARQTPLLRQQGLTVALNGPEMMWETLVGVLLMTAVALLSKRRSTQNLTGKKPFLTMVSNAGADTSDCLKLQVMLVYVKTSQD